MNIYQAALQLRTNYGHLDIITETTDCAETNLYFVFHDALHTLLGQPPVEENEALVLAAELLLGGQDYTIIPSLAKITADQISNSLSLIDAETLEILIEYYTNRYN